MIKHRGFSIIEVLVVIAILGIISYFGFTTYQHWRYYQQLVTSKENLASVLYRAQQLATAAAGGKDWGVHLEENSYTLFASSTYDSLDPTNKIWYLDKVAVFRPTSTFAKDLSLRGADVIFGKFTGETNNTGTITLFFIPDNNQIQEIKIEASGLIDL
ncbi:MAG: hypothetical protein C3F02_03060 [Parcubacteria group bacterium]|nr:MAG: hypothetical protein C3F02_03060 [Parcubacteria group bacterium]